MRQLVLLLYFLTTLNLSVFAGDSLKNTKPNILVIFTDDQVYRAIAYNNPAVKTPHLDKLAREGLILNNVYVASPICTASRAAMMSGVYPQQNGVVALNHKAFKKYYAGAERAEQSLPRQMKKAGYHCAFWGKSHIGPPKSYGFDEGEETKGHDDVETFKRANSFLQKAAKSSKPFFLWLAPRQPHLPLYPQQKWLDLYNENELKLDANYLEEPLPSSVFNQGKPGENFHRDSNYTKVWKKLPGGPPRNEATMRSFIKAYYAVISHLDSQVGQMIENMEQLGIKDNTVIVFLSDNGYHLGNHGLGNKITMHEESVRVPMFINWSQLTSKGKRSDALVSSLDLYPSLLDLAGVPLPNHLMGKSLLPIFKDEKANVRQVVFSECVGVGAKVGEGHRMARNKKWKYILTGTDEQFLYNQSKDPYELSNQTGKPEQLPILNELKRSMSKWMEQIGDRKFPHAIK
ncbi:hypothetical protein LNTAR_06729 [Lentisphaera araneosa HTCC2155]|uniref:Sulfatase N-terminal domain-containing protein n=1 Tax=Lentisphaera araneosa HTCC2155 TaxID=313628 RepID=A6DNH2_9BACT|nr:sulfatase-like hydrolase/transferase [Lentisphaera araneosa]EDM26920.1 hypothetical protein LNTAR_06729 [Lentisphaera araneosa HTCC2155]